MTASFRTIESKIIPFENLGRVVATLGKGKKIVTTNGCFDILHQGHVTYLQKAKQLGDYLICGVNSDRSVKALGKGDDRPVFSQDTRARQVAALESVDLVVIFDQDTPEEFIRIVRPKIHVKGADYAGKTIPEQSVIDEVGGSLELIPLVEGYSTTSILNRLRNM